MFAFKVGFLKDAEDFLQTLPKKVYEKIIHNIERIAGGERNVELFRKLEGTEIWEFRTSYSGIAYRLFAFWDTEKETMVVATHGIVKKTKKTPRKEIAKAEAIRKRYFDNKNKQK